MLHRSTIFFATTDWIPDDADIVKAETVRQRVFLMPGPATKTVGGCEIRQLCSNHGGSAGYFISGEGAARLLAETENRCDPLDHVLFHPWIGVVQKMSVYQMDPAIGVQDYLLHDGAKKRGFASTLNADRLASRRGQAVKGKPKRLAKVWREVSRPFVRAIRPLIDRWRNLRGTALIKKIPYKGDPGQ